MNPNLGMYVHMHWGYNHPYCARTWTFGDWRGYAGGLKALGYNLIMIWPMLEIIPDPLTPSDVAHLEKMQQVIDYLHELGMTVIITLGANTVGNDRARDFEFAKRPFFLSDLRLNPGDPAAVDRLISFRDKLFSYLGKADGCSIIDSDPGGYIGSTNAEFAELLSRHLDMFRRHNPVSRVYYWMWCGWEPYNKMWQEIEEGICTHSFPDSPEHFEPVVERMMSLPDDGWGVLSCTPTHQDVVRKLGIQDRALYYPYGWVEGEPTFPRTNCDPTGLASCLSAYSVEKTKLGTMANSQSHVVQLPGAFLYSHFAKGGTEESVDLAQFADGLVPGLGTEIADAWNALNLQESAEILNTKRRLAQKLSGSYASGPYSGLMIGGVERYLEDLSLQLQWHADMRRFAAAVGNGDDWHEPLNALADSWGAWQSRNGFSETHMSNNTAFVDEALRAVHDPGIDEAIAQLDDWSAFEKRHGLLPKLIQAMRAAARSAD